MKTLTALLLAATLGGCATAPPPRQCTIPTPKACVKAPPPPVGSHRMVVLKSKLVEPEKGIGVLVVQKFGEFTMWLVELGQWADETYAACKDPSAPAGEPTFPKLKPSPKETSPGHHLDEDED